MYGSHAALPLGQRDHPLFNEPDKWTLITFGPSFGIAIDTKNNVHVWGQNRVTKEYINPYIACTISGIVDCQCTEDAAYLLTLQGNVYIIPELNNLAFGGSACKVSRLDELPECMELKRLKIVKMGVGNSHAAFVTGDGELYCRGDNTFGQCAKPPRKLTNDAKFVLPINNNPLDNTDWVQLNKVNFKPSGVKINNVVCGGRHTVCVDDNNNIYTFGDDSTVQLFLGDTRGKSILDFGRYRQIIRRSETHVKSEIVYSGRERHLQYNPVKVNDYAKIREYQALFDNSHVLLAAGDDFSVIALVPMFKPSQVANSVTVLTSGNNKYAQCGTMDQRMFKAHAFKLPQNMDPSNRITCGHAHCLTLLESQQLFGWGSNQQKQLLPFKKGTIITPQGIPLVDVVDRVETWSKVMYYKCAYNNTAVITH